MATSGDASLDAYQVRLLWLGVLPFAERWEPEGLGPAAWRLSFCDEVGASLDLGQRVAALPAGQVVLIPPAAAGAKPDGDVLQLLVQFQLNAATSEHAAALGREPLVLVPDELRDRLCARLRRDLKAGADLDMATCARAAALVHLSVAAALESGRHALARTAQTEDAERQLLPVLRYIDAHLEEPLENARLAAFVHASESHFIRLFRRVVGCTPARHVQERRVRHAADLLARTSLTIDEIAERSGFANRFHFSRVFVQRMALPPGRYRVQHASQPGNAAGPAR